MGKQEMNMQSFIENALATVRHTYVSAPVRIIADYNKERDTISDYNGRQLLEMLQNADDESNTAQNKIAYIELNKGHLTIANNGNAFSQQGVLSLMYSNFSPKFKQQNKIGSKGTGFRSILSWAETVYIKSYDLSIEFSGQNAVGFLDGLLAATPSIKEFLEDNSPVEHPIAILLTPRWKEPDDGKYAGYDTYIDIKLKTGKESDVQDQINGLDKETLLFLHNLQRIVIKSPGREETIEKIPSENGAVRVRVLSASEEITSEKIWVVRNLTGKYQKKNYELAVAYSPSLDDKKNILYSYFRTDVQFPFPAVIHGTFELTGDRNHLVRSGENEHLLRELTQLLITVAKEISGSTDSVSWDAVRLLSFDSSFDEAINSMKFEEALLAKIKETPLLPSISGQYISYSDAKKPVFYSRDYGSILPADKFPNLTIYTEDKRITQLIQKLGRYTYKSDSLFTQINSISAELSMPLRARLIAYLLLDYNEALQTCPKEQLPSLFTDDTGTVIPNLTEIFLPRDTALFRLPSYVKIRFLNSELFALLCQQLNVKSGRALSEKLAVFNVQEYNFETVLRRVINQTNAKIAADKSKKLKYMRLLITFLWEIYREATREGIPQNLNVPLLNRFEAKMNAKDLFLGKEYGCHITENLLKHVGKKLFVCSAKVLGLDREN